MKKNLMTTVVCLLSITVSAQNLKPFKSDKEKWGFKDESGKEIISAKYEYALEFSEGLALVINKKNKYGFVDQTGKEIIPLKYDRANSFAEGLALVRLTDKYGFVDITGKEVIPLKYDEAGDFSDGLAKVRFGALKDEKYGTLKGGRWGFIDKSGNEAIPLTYENAGDFRQGLAYVKLNDKYGFIDKTGKLVIPNDYDDASDFREGLAMVRVGGYLDGKWGFVDKTGELVIPAKFEEASSFYEGEARVQLNGKTIYIDKTGSNEEERKQKAKEEAERIEKQETKDLTPPRKDTLALEVLKLFLVEYQNLFTKVTDLQNEVERTMGMNLKNEFDKRNWLAMSPVIDAKANIATEQLKSYKSLLKQFESIRGKNELYNQIAENLERTSAFIASCREWGSYISTLGENSDGKTELYAVSNQLTALKKQDDSLRSFIALYMQRNGL